MRIVVDARRALGERLQHASLALARRGHLVHWLGPARSREGVSGIRPVNRVFDLARIEADALVAPGARPSAALAAAWFSRSGVQVFDLTLDRIRHWGPLDRWAWSAGYSAGLLEPGEAEAARSGEHGLAVERLALWPDDPPARDADPAHPDAEILERALERALARRRGAAPRRAVFLDRDGTLIVERGYLSDPAGVELIPGVGEALRQLRGAGFALVVISNQAGVGRGLFGLTSVYAAMARLREALRGEGVELDAIYFCPHHPDEGCACRKPGTALLERAAEDLQLSLRHSAMAGDKLLDVEAGRRAGGAGVLVLTGHGREEAERLRGEPGAPAPDAVCDDFAAAARWILERAGTAREEELRPALSARA